MKSLFNPDPSFEFDSENHLYYLKGNIIPGTTGVLQKKFPFFYNGDPVPRAKGIYVHKCINLFLQGKLDEDSLVGDVDKYINQVKHFLFKFGFKGHEYISEIPMYNRIFEYGFTPDLFFPELGVVIDFKSGSYIDRAKFEFQMVAYLEGLNSWGYNITKMITVVVNGKEENYKYKRLNFIYNKNVYREFIQLKKTA